MDHGFVVVAKKSLPNLFVVMLNMQSLWKTSMTMSLKLKHPSTV